MKKWHWIALGVIAAITLVLEFTLLADYDSHWWNSVPAFYMLWGFIGSVAVIFISRWLGKLFILSDEDYYDR
ncbi:MAG: hypothetical protein WD016_06375 [Balneolaceae bacterium]